MSKFLHQLFCSVNVTLLSSLLIFPVRAQISSDGTTNTTVNVDGNDFIIQEGDRAGSNLFHSFTEFSVPIRGKAFFDNSLDIDNIFSRVTGGNISNIDGILGAHGTANLFLINPAGIIFGEHASLDIGGSFLGSTADSIVFPDGEFSATDLNNPPLITINAPIGLQFRETAAEIINRSRFEVENELPGRTVDSFVAGLRVEPGKTLALLGGNLTFEGGNLNANGGRIELGSVGFNNFVNLNLTEDGLVLDYAEVENFQDINFLTRTSEETGGSIVHGTIIDASGDTKGGTIQVQGRQVNLTGDAMDSPIVIFSSTGSQGEGETIFVKASESIELLGDFAGISTLTRDTGSAGNIIIETQNITMSGGSFIASFPSSNETSNAGDIDINASESVELIGRNRTGDLPTSIFSDAEGGDGGNLRIKTKQLSIQNGAQISTSTFGEGQAGNIDIVVSESIILSGFSELNTTDSNRSGIFVSTQLGSTGNAGILNITAKTLTIENGARISANTRGPGQGNETVLNLENLVIQTGGEIGAGSLIDSDDDFSERGDGGNLTITANDSIEIIGTNDINGEAVNSRIFTLTDWIGDAGNLTIDTNQLTVSNGGEINVNSTGTGDAGQLRIRARNIDLNQGSLIATTKEGAGGNITLEVTENLTLRNNSTISSEAFNEANGGDITIAADFILGFPSTGLGSDIRTDADAGEGGDININAQGILGFEVSELTTGKLNNINDIDASSKTNVSGNININAPDANPLQGANRLPTNPVSTDTVASNTCSIRERTASLTIKGKGGISPEPTTFLTADVLIPDGKPIIRETGLTSLVRKIEGNQENFNHIPSHIKPVPTDNGDLYPARGIVKTADGKIILTAYSNPETTTRNLEKSLGCG